MKKIKKVVVLLALFLGFITCITPALAAGASSSSNSTSSSAVSGDELAKIKANGKLVVGLSADYPPLEFTKKINGKTEYVGVDIEIAKQIAKDLGVKLEIKNLSFDSLLVAMETGKIDVIISGMNPTAERKQSVDFSDTYYSGGKSFLIMKGDKNKYKNKDSFVGKKVGAQNGTTEYKLIKSDVKGATPEGLSKLSNLVLDLQSRKIDGVLMDSLIAKAYAANNKQFVAIDSGIEVSEDQSGVAVALPKNQPALKTAINKTLGQIKKDNLIDKKYVPQAAKYMETVKQSNGMLNYWNYFAKGVGYTILITVISVAAGFVLGTLLALMRLAKSKFLHAIAVCYIEFIRGTPLMVQIMFVYFGIGALIGSLPALLAGIIAISLNSGAYVAEVIRSGIESIPAGQTEAARSLGLSQGKTYRYVIIPQALKNIWPALGNEFITLLKDSSMVSIIGVTELMYQTQLVQTTTYKGVLPLFITMLLYFVMTFTVSKFLGYFEGKMKHNG